MTMPENVQEQTPNALATIEKSLAEAGFAMDDVVRARYIVSDRAYVAEVFAVTGAVFGDHDRRRQD